MDEITGQGNGRSKGADPYDDEIDLMSLVLALWRRWWVIAGAAVLCGLAAFTLGTLSAPIYDASVKLMVSPPKTALAGELLPAVNVPTFRALVENQSIAARVIHEFKLDAPPYRLTPQAFLRRALSVETTRDSNLVVLRVRLASRDLPAQVANRLAALSLELSAQLSRDETVRTRDDFKAQVDASRARLEAAEQRLSAFKQQAQVEALRKDVEAQLGQRAGLLPLLVEIQAEKARLATAEAQLAARKPIGTVRRTIDSDPALMEAAKETAPSRTSVLGLEVTNEYLSKVYEELDQRVAESRTKLSGLERQKAELIDARRLDSGQLTQLNQLYAREMELARLQTEYDLAKSVYIEVSTRYEQVRLQVAGRSAQLQLVDGALPSDRPVGPKVFRNTVVAFALGAVLSAFAVLLVGAVRSAAGKAA